MLIVRLEYALKRNRNEFISDGKRGLWKRSKIQAMGDDNHNNDDYADWDFKWNHRLGWDEEINITEGDWRQPLHYLV